MKKLIRVLAVAVAAAGAMLVAAGPAQAAPAEYTVVVRTCNVSNAGTDANVQIWMSSPGSFGSGWLVLDNSGDDRERGQTDTYRFRLTDFGPLDSVTLSFDDSGGSPDWCLTDVTVWGPHGVTVHPFNNWLRDAGDYWIPAA